MFDYILHWSLVAGSYGFTGPDGKTSGNDAMLLAAGLKYPIRRLSECPKRFSPPITAYALGLHEKMPCKVRQELFPFLVGLAGSADRPDIEEKRIEFIWVETMHRIMGPLAKMARRFYADLWKDCMAVKNLDV